MTQAFGCFTNNYSYSGLRIIVLMRPLRPAAIHHNSYSWDTLMEVLAF